MCLNKWYLFLKWLCKSDFLNLSTMDFWGWMVLCCEGFVPCNVSSTPALYPLDTRSPYPWVLTIKTHLKTWPNVPCGAKSPSVENIYLTLMYPMPSNAAKFNKFICQFVFFFSWVQSTCDISRQQLLNNSGEHLKTITESMSEIGP